MLSPIPVLTLPGKGTQAHARVAQFDERAGALCQPHTCQQDVPATHVTVSQALVLLGGKERGIASRGL